MAPSRAQTQTTRSGVELTNHEATTPPFFASNGIIVMASILIMFGGTVVNAAALSEDIEVSVTRES